MRRRTLATGCTGIAIAVVLLTACGSTSSSSSSAAGASTASATPAPAASKPTQSGDALLKAISQKAGTWVGSIKKVNVGASLLPSVVSGKVDAILGGYRNVEAVQVKDQGLNPTVIPVTQAGVPQYDELVIIANAH